MIDYHVHTVLCNHANGAMDQYIEAAVAAGLREICFLDHLTLHESGRRQSMAPVDVPFYFHSVRQLAHQYRDRIAVKAGLEVDFDPETADAAGAIIQPFDFDVIGGSVHFIDNINIVSRKSTRERERRSFEAICARYLERLDEMVSRRFADMVCHLDVVKKFGNPPSPGLSEKFDALLEKISYTGLTVELNTSGMDHPAGDFYPGTALLKACRHRGIPVTLGSDAHEPGQVGRYFDRALAVLQDAGFREVTGFTRRAGHGIPIP